MSSRDGMRTVLGNLLEEEMGEAYTELDDERDLREGLGLDSVDIVGLVMRVEREFHIRLSLEELSAVKTVGEMIDLVGKKVAESRNDTQASPPLETDGQAAA